MSERMQKYQHGHEVICNVPQQHHPDPQLSGRVEIQRHNYKQESPKENQHGHEVSCNVPQQHRPDPQLSGRVEIHNCKQSLKGQWMEMFKRLKAYQQENNSSCDVPRRYPQDPQLGNWVNKQRYNHKTGLLSKERYDQLEAIGFQWAATTKLEPPLSTVSKSSQSGTQGSLRWCWL